MTEFSPNLYQLLDQVFIDTEFAKRESGDVAKPLAQGWLKKEQVYTLAKLIEGKVEKSPAETTCFKSVGAALFDLVAEELIYEKAWKKDWVQSSNFIARRNRNLKQYVLSVA